MPAFKDMGHQFPYGCREKIRQGFSLVEVAVAMVIFIVLGISLCNLLSVSAVSQVNHQIQTSCEHVATNILELLRADLRFARTAQVAQNGSLLTITLSTAPNPVVYQFTNNTLIRTDPLGHTLDFRSGNINDPALHPMTIFCNGACFTTSLSPVDATIVDQVTLNNLVVRDASVQGTSLDNATNFVDPNTGQDYSRTQFRVQQSTFNILNGQAFQ